MSVTAETQGYSHRIFPGAPRGWERPQHPELPTKIASEYAGTFAAVRNNTYWFNGTLIRIGAGKEIFIGRERTGEIQERRPDGKSLPDTTRLVWAPVVNGKISQTTHVLWDPFQTKTIWEDPRATMDASGTLYITGTHVKLTDHDYGKYIPVIAKISLGDFVSTLDPQMLEASLREIPRIGKNALVIPGQNGQKNRALVRLDGEEKRQQRKRLTRFSVYEEQQDGEWTETGVIDFKSVLPKPKDTYRIGTGGGPIFLDNGDVAIGTHRIIWEKGVYKYILGVSVLESDLHPYAWFDLADYDFLKGQVDQDPDMAHVPRHNPIGKQVVYSVDMHYVLKNDGTEDHEQLECLVTMFDNSIVKLRFSKRELVEKAQRARELVQNQVSSIGTLRRGTGLNPLELRIVD